MHWRDMAMFRGVDLNDSFVSGWTRGPSELTFEIEASVWPESPFYRAPRPDEYTCYRKVRLIFRGCEIISGLRSLREAPTFTDTDGESDYGSIDSLMQTATGFRIFLEFGEVEIEGDTILLEFDEA